MADEKPSAGSVFWMDLTVPDAEKNRRFYEAVVGWKPVPVEMEGYNDYCMNTPGDDKTVAGICHARGENGNLPAQWLIYINVDDLAESLRKCTEQGGQILVPARASGDGQMAVIQDPAGAVAALYQTASAAE